jgi:uncharacterized integral membrane protein
MNPATEKLRQCIHEEFKVYNNLAPKFGLLAYTIFFFAYFIFKVITVDSLNLMVVDTLAQSFQYSILIGILGFIVGKFMSGKLQTHQLHVLQKERVRRRKALKKQLQTKREALSKLEAMII